MYVDDRGQDRETIPLGEMTQRMVAVYFFPASMASPFLHATILIFGADTWSLDSILNVGFLTMNVHTSSHRR